MKRRALVLYATALSLLACRETPSPEPVQTCQAKHRTPISNMPGCVAFTLNCDYIVSTWFIDCGRDRTLYLPDRVPNDH